MTEKTWTHKGHTIRMLVNGEFCTDHAGKVLTTTSLAGMKTKLDKLESFAAFDVIYYRYGWYDPEYRKVVGVRSVRGKKLFVLDNARETDRVILDTPANRKAIEKYTKLREANQLKRTALDETEKAARELATYKRPE